ncbi:MAG: hypothetical protein WAK04_15040, partial [Xanthobacteraceae bacterium]
GNRSAGLEPEPHKVMLRDNAAVVTPHAAHHDNRARTLHYIAYRQLNLVTDSQDSNRSYRLTFCS